MQRRRRCEPYAVGVGDYLWILHGPRGLWLIGFDRYGRVYYFTSSADGRLTPHRIPPDKERDMAPTCLGLIDHGPTTTADASDEGRP